MVHINLHCRTVKIYMQDAHNAKLLAELHIAALDIVGMMNGPQRDAMLIREAGIHLETVLFPLLVLVGKLGPIGVVELADRVGRDYTTVSRQLGRLEALGLIARAPAAHDRRVRQAVVAPAGAQMTAAIDRARERVLRKGFADWPGQDLEDLVRLVGRLAQTMRADQDRAEDTSGQQADSAKRG